MKIIIPGTPVPQARMRLGRWGVFDPNAQDKKKIRAYLAQFGAIPVKFEQPRVSFIFYMPVPKQIPKKQLEIYLSERKKHKKKPDVDNLIKLYLDCLDDIFFTGDQNISLGPCVKIYSATPRTVVLIEEMTDTLQDKDLDHSGLHAELCGIPSS